MDFTERVIDMDVQLKTQAGKNISKIPLVGYILAGGDDDASLSLKIQGGIDNPEVSHSLLEDIVVYPFEVLYRTLKLPQHLAEQFSQHSDNPNTPSSSQEDTKE